MCLLEAASKWGEDVESVQDTEIVAMNRGTWPRMELVSYRIPIRYTSYGNSVHCISNPIAFQFQLPVWVFQPATIQLSEVAECWAGCGCGVRTSYREKTRTWFQHKIISAVVSVTSDICKRSFVQAWYVSDCDKLGRWPRLVKSNRANLSQ